MNPKYQKVCAEIAKTEKKVEDLQGQLKELYDRQQGGKAYHYPAGGDGQ